MTNARMRFTNDWPAQLSDERARPDLADRKNCRLPGELDLGHSLGPPHPDDAPGRLLADPSTGSAILVLDSARSSWVTRGGLERELDGFVKPIGWLGTFRRSRRTELWFQGAEEIHARGNNQTSPNRAPAL